MSRKMIVEVKVRLVINADENLELNNVIDEMDYNFDSGEGFEITDSEILDYDLIYSK